jgi:hypothetical protein
VKCRHVFIAKLGGFHTALKLLYTFLENIPGKRKREIVKQKETRSFGFNTLAVRSFIYLFRDLIKSRDIGNFKVVYDISATT